MENQENFSFQEKAAEKKSSLMDGYLKFDPDFFHPRKVGLPPEERQKQKEEIAKEYSEVLQNETLRQILDGKKSIEELPRTVGEKLRDLIDCEEKFPTVLSKNPILERILEAASISELKREHSPYVSGRASGHLFRLLFPREYGITACSKAELLDKAQNTVSENFAKEYLSYIIKLGLRTNKEIRDVMEIIGGEGTDTLMFWTLSPYIQDELKRFGNSAEKSMEKIFQWTKEAGSKVVQNGFQDRDFDYTDFWKLGIRGVDFVLGLDERMPSHLLSRLLAKRVAESLNKEIK